MQLPNSRDVQTQGDGAQVVACLAEGRRLFIVYSLLLDADIQPSEEDFSVKVKGKFATITSAQLQSPLGAGSSWSVITLLTDRALPTATEVTLAYHPIQWLMCSLEHEAPIAAFEITTRLLDGAALAPLTADPDKGEDQEGAKVVSGAKAAITSACGKRVKIKLERELDIYQKLDAADFRAELSDRWLTVTKTYFNQAEGAAAELWVELREMLEAGSQIKVSFKSPNKLLKTRDGTAIVSFTAAGITTAANGASAATPQTPASSSHHGLAVLSRLYDTLSATDKELAALMGFRPQSTEPESPPAPVAPSPPAPTAALEVTAPPPLTAVPAPPEDEPPDDNPEVTDNDEAPVEPALPVNKPLRVGAAAGTALTLLVVVYIGSLIFSDDAEVSGASAGECAVDYPDGGRYMGACVDGKRHGMGHYLWASGADYRGGWAEDTMHGEGVMTLKNGARIEGKWQGGESVGLTTITWPNGTRYVGQVRNTQPNGIGKITYANGDTYKGEFENSLMHGKGTMTWTSGAKYSGEYQGGKASGQGIYWSTDGNRFEGLFAEGKPTRKGTCYRADGSSKLGRCTR